MRKLVFILMLLNGTCIFAGITSGNNGWFKFFSGKSGEKKADIYLERYDSVISGYIFFEDTKQPERIIGAVKGDSLMLNSYTVNSSFDSYTGVLKNGNYKGIYTFADSENKTDFEFKEESSVSSLFDFFYAKDEKQLFKNFKKSPTASYMQGCIWPSEEYHQYEYLRKVITDLKRFPQNISSISGDLKKNMESFFSDYYKDYNGVTKQEIEKDDFAISSNSEEEEDLLVPAYFDDNIFVLSEMDYSFTGGAHGNYGTGYTTIDLKNNRILKLTDIINESDTVMLTPLLEKYFRKQFEVSDSSTLTDAGLFTDTINANDNFCLTPGCLMFCYTPYEIGPWAMGEVNIYIPINEIENYLKPEAKNLIQ